MSAAASADPERASVRVFFTIAVSAPDDDPATPPESEDGILAETAYPPTRPGIPGTGRTGPNEKPQSALSAPTPQSRRWSSISRFDRAPGNSHDVPRAIALARPAFASGHEPAHKPVSRPRRLVDQVDGPTHVVQLSKIVQARLPRGAAESPEMSMETGRVVTWSREDSGSAPISRWSA